mgnify:CR=1 FL=1
MKIRIELNNEDVKELILDSCCNGGLQSLAYSGIRIDWDNHINNRNYKLAKELLVKENPEKTFCYEDVLIKVILDNGVYFKDYEGYEDDELFHFTFDLAKDNLQKALDKDDGSLAKIIHKIIPEYNDADGYDYDVVMQTAMYGELTYS